MVIIYTTPTCGSCHMVEKLFKKLDVEFEKVDISNDPNLQQMLIEKTKSLTVPITQVGAKYIVGYNPSALMQAVRSQ